MIFSTLGSVDGNIIDFPGLALNVFKC
jgi:hypothetical protein